jgi:hypothetical protein
MDGVAVGLYRRATNRSMRILFIVRFFEPNSPSLDCLVISRVSISDLERDIPNSVSMLLQVVAGRDVASRLPVSNPR